MELYASDAFIVAGTLANIAVFVWIWVESFRVYRPKVVPREHVHFEGVAAFD
jgi:hypothetical protein